MHDEIPRQTNGISLLQEVKTLVVLAGPICCNSMLTSLVNVITLAYAGPPGHYCSGSDCAVALIRLLVVPPATDGPGWRP